MELSAFLDIYAAAAPLRALADAYPTVDTVALTTLFLRPADDATSREELHREFCALVESRCEYAALRHKRIWAEVTETNRIKKRFGYSDIGMTPAETNKMWRMVEAMQSQGGSVAECAAMCGIPQGSFLRLQSAWRASHDTSSDEEKEHDVSTADVDTPLASPQSTPPASPFSSSQVTPLASSQVTPLASARSTPLASARSTPRFQLTPPASPRSTPSPESQTFSPPDHWTSPRPAPPARKRHESARKRPRKD